MKKRFSLISDFILVGYVLEGLTYVFDWSKVLVWIALGTALLSLVMSVISAFKTKHEAENRGKWMKKSIYYILLSSLLMIICLFRGLSL